MINVFGRKIDGGILLNKTFGGEGASGRIMSEEVKEKIISNGGKAHSFQSDLRKEDNVEDV